MRNLNDIIEKRIVKHGASYEEAMEAITWAHVLLQNAWPVLQELHLSQEQLDNAAYDLDGLQTMAQYAWEDTYERSLHPYDSDWD